MMSDRTDYETASKVKSINRKIRGAMLDRSDSDDGDKAENFEFITDSENNNNNPSTANVAVLYIDQIEIEFSESYMETSPSPS